MQKSSIYILCFAGGIGIISVLYFFSLILHIPYVACTLFSLTALTFFCRWANKLNTEEPPANSFLSLLILLTGVIIITNETYYQATKYGAWDAWAIWDLHAHYLTDADNWKNMFLNKEHAHPDYPLALPGVLAFLYKPFPREIHYLISFILHYSIMLCIPVLLLLQTYRRSILLASMAFFYLLTRDIYLIQGTYYLADTLLALFFMSAFIAMDGGEEDNRFIILTGAMLGCCAWTKNEGIVLGIVFMLFYWRTLFAKKNLKYTVIGLSPFLLVLLIFKGVYAPGNDLVTSQHGDTLRKLLDAARYKTVWLAFRESVSNYYYLPACGVALTVLISIVRRKALPKAISVILVCCLIYLLVYIVTPLDLEWHLKTSIDRVLYQLIPATLYVLVMYLTGGSLIRLRGGFSSIRPFPR
ncbi:MAG: hypothetical protein BGO70_11665 [Bacteroidetes bacterium 43-93]|nr:hypothetical protein [Bacteroidota bacterium]OJW98121.1 MAG: hypothetical protein BGO70_11665 [Bacteroidetes bacterium 43-93]